MVVYEVEKLLVGNFITAARRAGRAGLEALGAPPDRRVDVAQKVVGRRQSRRDTAVTAVTASTRDTCSPGRSGCPSATCVEEGGAVDAGSTSTTSTAVAAATDLATTAATPRASRSCRVEERRPDRTGGAGIAVDGDRGSTSRTTSYGRREVAPVDRGRTDEGEILGTLDV
jgi:hypothetical protein